MKRVVLIAACLASGLLTVAQTPPSPLPCPFDGPVLRQDNGSMARLDSDAMKRRATHKTDVPDYVKQFDINGTVVAEVLVAPSGKVVCARSVVGHPLIAKPVQAALEKWTFKPAKQGGKPVAYVGLLQFRMCNMLCGTKGTSMTLLK